MHMHMVEYQNASFKPVPVAGGVDVLELAT
jgi:hypothetical protein